jgi:hypothetical protein
MPVEPLFHDPAIRQGVQGGANRDESGDKSRRFQSLVASPALKHDILNGSPTAKAVGEPHSLSSFSSLDAKWIVYPEPHQLDPESQTEAINLFSTLPPSHIEEFMKEQEYSAMACVECGDDKAVGILQYFNWCMDTEDPQLWITDLCRITKGPKQPISPVRHLMDLFADLAIEHGIYELWIMVEKGPSLEILVRIYEGYGFVVTFRPSPLEDVIFLRKKLNPSDPNK